MNIQTIPAVRNRWANAGKTAFLVLLWTLTLHGRSPADGNAVDKNLKPEQMNIRGLALLEQKNYGEAKNCFSLAVHAVPANKYYYNNLAVACINLRDYIEAQKHLKKALELDPRYSKALSNMAVTCFYLYQFSDAYHYYRLARGSDPGYVKVRFEKYRVIRKLEHMESQKPGSTELRALIDYLKTSEEMP